MNVQNDYSSAWAKAYGIDNDPVRQHIVFPLFRERVGRAEPRAIADLGCGNGSMISNLIQIPFETLVAIDMNPNFLEQARSHLDDDRVNFVQEDLLEMHCIADASVDAALSVFVINELRDLGMFFRNVARILATGGSLFMVCTHPFVPLIAKKKEDWGLEKNNKITGVNSYFSAERGVYHFTLVDDYCDHYHYNLQHIMAAISQAGLRAADVVELGSGHEGFQSFPQYWQTRDLPNYLFMEVSKLPTI
jgi:ubiquinone/menaquinone biosynthesis C-methylase UbiE